MTVAPQIEAHGPDVEQPAFKERFSKRLEQLFEDLKLGMPGAERARFVRGDRRKIAIDERELVVPATRAWLPAAHPAEVGAALRREAESEANAVVAAEAFAAALIRHRWIILRGVLADVGAPDRAAALEAASEKGLHLDALVELHDAAQSDDELLWLSAERHPPQLELISAPTEAPDEGRLASAAERAATLLGFHVPRPTVALDEELSPGQFRLRVGRVRGPVERAPIAPTKTEDPIAAAIFRAGPALLDVRVLLLRLLDRDATPPDFAREALTCVPVLRAVEALRALVAQGFSLVDPRLMCEALIHKKAPLAQLPSSEKLLLTLPGAYPPPASGAADPGSRWRDDLRAALAPATLRVKADNGFDRTRISAHVLGNRALETLRSTPSEGWFDALAEALAKRAREDDVLLAPTDVRPAVAAGLLERCPGLAVVAPGDIPAGVEFLQRGKPLSI